MTKDEALRLALEALESTGENNGYHGVTQYFDETMVDQAISAIKAALEAKDGECKYCTDGCPACDARKLPEQEPVAWAKFSAKGNIIDLLSEPDDDYTPLYTTPPQRTWVGLTDEEILAKCESVPDYDIGNHDLIHFARVIEAQLRSKNT
jgi:hypothetical protein